MIFQEFKKNVIGKSLDYDGIAGYQCVDLVKVYLDWCFGIKPGAWGNAVDYWNNLNKPGMSENFTRIPNTRSLVIQDGDIVVWNTNVGGGYGHVAIGTSDSNMDYFVSLDQNWGSEDVRYIRHNYDNVLGVLRPKNINKLMGRLDMDALRGKNLTFEELKQLPKGTLVTVEGGWLIDNQKIGALGSKYDNNNNGFVLQFNGTINMKDGGKIVQPEMRIFFDWNKYNTSIFRLK